LLERKAFGEKKPARLGNSRRARFLARPKFKYTQKVVKGQVNEKELQSLEEKG
jgi:hypothetical protein